MDFMFFIPIVGDGFCASVSAEDSRRMGVAAIFLIINCGMALCNQVFFSSNLMKQLLFIMPFRSELWRAWKHNLVSHVVVCYLGALYNIFYVV